LPKIDAHSHIFEDIPEFVQMMKRNNLHIINICTRGNNLDNLKLMEARAEEIQQKYPDSFAFACTFDLTQRNQDDYADLVKTWLDRCYESGAVMTKIWKEVGMEIKTPDDRFIMPDDPIFDPIYEHIAGRGKPLLAHLAEPIAAWLPLNKESVHYGYYSNNPEWHMYGKEGFPSWEQIIAARDHILEKHPDLTFIGAHIGSMSHDVDEVAKRLDRYPNFFVEVAARTNDLSRQPKDKVRNFFIRYQDRILHGVDLGVYSGPDDPMTEEEKLAAVERVEARYRREFKYYAGTGKVELAGKEVDGLGLPEDVLKKFYYENAKKLIPGLPF
jgi:predicted TIM-barrel fold metal-dependent hydrolase